MIERVGSISLAKLGVEQILADSVTFRASVRAENADEALRHIHFEELLGLDRALSVRDQRPCAIILSDSHGYDPIGFGVGPQMGARGGVVAVLAKNALPSADPKEVVIDFDNWLGSILDEATDLVARGDTYYPFQRIEIVEGPGRTDLDNREEDDFWLAVALFTHNVNAEQ